MAEIVPFDPNVHMEDYVQMYIEYITWVNDELVEKYQVDLLSSIGQTASEFVDDNLEPYMSLKPPDGVLYMLEVEGAVAVMGVKQKLREGVGEIKRMYNRPQYRGRGYGRQMLNKLLETGRELGFTTFLLDSPRFAFPAHNLYRSSGFIDRDPYPESGIPSDVRQYWLFMEKKE